jgi:sulfide:quinone oxidoreductase
MTVTFEPLSATPARTDLHHEIVVIGGGNAGISVAARLCRVVSAPDIAIVEPSDTHYYQPLWIGWRRFCQERSAGMRRQSFPARQRVQDRRRGEPEENVVLWRWEGNQLQYLVVAPGIQSIGPDQGLA